MAGKNMRRLSFYFRQENNKPTAVDKNTKPTTEVNLALKELKIELTRINQFAVQQPVQNFEPKVESKIVKETNLRNRQQENNKDNKDKQQPLRRSARNLPGAKDIVKPERERSPDISSLPSIIFRGTIKFAKDFYRIASYCDEILQNVEKCTDDIVPIGFDLEWPFSFQTGSGKTALAQICMSEDVCYLLHIYSLTKLPAALAVLLSHPKVKLVGVNIKNDVWKLTRDFKEIPGAEIVKNNCLDSGVYLNKVFGRSGRWSLERLTAYVLRKRISKTSSVRRSKWHILPLSDDQKNYAATDAYVSWLLHTKIAQKEKEDAEKQNSADADQDLNPECL